MGAEFNSGSVAKTRCYIVRNSDNEVCTFQFNPTVMNYSRSVKYISIDSPGMSYPLTQYVGGEVREFSFDVFYYDGFISTGKIQKAREFLESLLPPEYNKKGFIKPPTFTLAYGYFVRTFVLTKLDVKDEKLDVDGNPIMTTFTLTVRQVGK